MVLPPTPFDIIYLYEQFCNWLIPFEIKVALLKIYPKMNDYILDMIYPKWECIIVKLPTIIIKASEVNK